MNGVIRLPFLVRATDAEWTDDDAARLVGDVVTIHLPDGRVHGTVASASVLDPVTLDLVIGWPEPGNAGATS